MQGAEGAPAVRFVPGRVQRACAAVTDAGATIDPGESCRSIDAHSARCVARSPSDEYLPYVVAHSGTSTTGLHLAMPLPEYRPRPIAWALLLKR